MICKQTSRLWSNLQRRSFIPWPLHSNFRSHKLNSATSALVIVVVVRSHTFIVSINSISFTLSSSSSSSLLLLSVKAYAFNNIATIKQHAQTHISQKNRPHQYEPISMCSHKCCLNVIIVLGKCVAVVVFCTEKKKKKSIFIRCLWC